MQTLQAYIDVDPESGERSVLILHNGKLLTTFWLGNDYSKMTEEEGEDFCKFIESKQSATMDERNRAAQIMTNYKTANLYISNDNETPISKACDDMLKRLRDGKPEEEL